MKSLNLALVYDYVNEHIDDFHKGRIASIERLSLRKLLSSKNMYLFKAKNVSLAQDLVESLLNAHISSSEEELFGQFLEQLAIFIAGQTCSGFKSQRSGVDLEFTEGNTYYIVQIKSGPKWGNSSQHKRLAQDFADAIADIQAKNPVQSHVQPVLGICYGKAKTTEWKNIAVKVEGQSFWHFISENPALYTDIIEPLGYRAKDHVLGFEQERSRVINRFTQELLQDFCTDGKLDWVSILEWNSKNLP